MGLYNMSGEKTISLFAGEGKGYATNGWVTSSDIRLKENIKTIDNALDKVLRLHGVTFEWKDKTAYSAEPQIGFLAQEVKNIIPSVVAKDGEYYFVDYARITAILVEAVKEQQKEIELLKTEVNELKKAMGK